MKAGLLRLTPLEGWAPRKPVFYQPHIDDTHVAPHVLALAEDSPEHTGTLAQHYQPPLATSMPSRPDALED